MLMVTMLVLAVSRKQTKHEKNFQQKQQHASPNPTTSMTFRNIKLHIVALFVDIYQIAL